MKLKYYTVTEDHKAIGLLEDNIHPQICYQLFSTSRQSMNYDAMLIAIKEISSNLEVYWMYAKSGQEAGPSRTVNQTESAEIGPGLGAKEIGALSWDNKKKGKGKGRGTPPQSNKCFNCGEEGHSIKDC